MPRLGAIILAELVLVMSLCRALCQAPCLHSALIRSCLGRMYNFTRFGKNGSATI